MNCFIISLCYFRFLSYLEYLRLHVFIYLIGVKMSIQPISQVVIWTLWNYNTRKILDYSLSPAWYGYFQCWCLPVKRVSSTTLILYIFFENIHSMNFTLIKMNHLRTLLFVSSFFYFVTNLSIWTKVIWESRFTVKNVDSYSFL